MTIFHVFAVLMGLSMIMMGLSRYDRPVDPSKEKVLFIAEQLCNGDATVTSNLSIIKCADGRTFHWSQVPMSPK